MHGSIPRTIDNTYGMYYLCPDRDFRRFQISVTVSYDTSFVSCFVTLHCHSVPGLIACQVVLQSDIFAVDALLIRS